MFTNQMNCHHGAFEIALRYGTCVPLHDLPDVVLLDGVIRVKEGMVHYVSGGIAFASGVSSEVFVRFDEVIFVKNGDGMPLWNNLELLQVFGRFCLLQRQETLDLIEFYQQAASSYQQSLDTLGEVPKWRVFKRQKQKNIRAELQLANHGLQFYKEQIPLWENAHQMLVQNSFYPLLDLIDANIEEALLAGEPEETMFNGDFPIAKLRYDLWVLASEGQGPEYKEAKQNLLLEFERMDDKDRKTIYISGTMYSINDLIAAIRLDTRVGREHVAMLLHDEED